MKLVLEVIGDCPVDGKRVLDVGCGRGGTIYTLKTFFQPATLTGLDLSATAVEFDRDDPRRRPHHVRRGRRREPARSADGSFDIVTNVESSHSYPNIHRFYSEVHRVLDARAGTSCTPTPWRRQQIASSAGVPRLHRIQARRNRDITRNVLLSCDEVSASRVQAFDSRNDRQLMQNFLATPGSQVYEEMRSGRWEYRIYTLRKHG